MARQMMFGSLRITRGALIIAVLAVAASIGYLAMGLQTRAELVEYLVATPGSVFDHGRVWTLITSPLVQPNFLSLLLDVFILWQFAPTMERFWGTPRFLRFAVITTIAGTLGGVLLGLALGTQAKIAGLDPFTWALVVAFGVVYARQPVQFFGAVPMTARQLMFGFLGLAVVVVLLNKQWEHGGAMAGGMLAAVVLTSKRWSPGLAWKRWRIARARAKLSVLEGGRSTAKKRDEQKWVN